MTAEQHARIKRETGRIQDCLERAARLKVSGEIDVHVTVQDGGIRNVKIKKTEWM